MIRSVNVQKDKSNAKQGGGPVLSASAFPGLPKVQDDLPHDFITGNRGGPSTSSAWNANKGSNNRQTSSTSKPQQQSGSTGGGGAGKKKKGKETLFTLGSALPT